MVPLAIVGRAVAVGVGEGVGLGRGVSSSSTGGAGVGDADFFGDAVADAFVFFLGEGLGDAFAVFFFFDVAFFFLGDAFGFGAGDLAGLGEAFATFWESSSDETCAWAGAPLKAQAISKLRQKRLTVRTSQKESQAG